MVPIKDAIPGLAKFLYMKATRRPRLVNLEITKLCNAGCDFCDYWQTKHEERLLDYSPVIKKINPIAVVITGGEPMLRKDLVDIVRQVKTSSFYIFTSMVTKGDLLTVEKAQELFDAGLDQIVISLDFIGKTHDKFRGIDGLWDYLADLLPKLGKRFKKKNGIIINTIIMDDNLDQIVDLVHQAKQWNIGVSFSSYSVMKTNNEAHFIDKNIDKVKEVVNELIDLRKKLKGTILTTEFYLKEIPGYFERGGVPDCTAGLSHIQVTPSGHLKRCSEMPVTAHYTEYSPDLYQKTNCTACWFSCRGETQSPATVKRALEYLGVWA